MAALDGKCPSCGKERCACVSSDDVTYPSRVAARQIRAKLAEQLVVNQLLVKDIESLNHQIDTWRALHRHTGAMLAARDERISELEGGLRSAISALKRHGVPLFEFKGGIDP